MCQQCAEQGLYDEDRKAQEAQEKDFFAKRTLGFEAMGKFFGYPDCCVKWFVNRANNIMRATSEAEFYSASLIDKSQEGFKEGFIPCPECAKKVTPGNEGQLITNRVHIQPFPVDEPYEELFDKFFIHFLKTKQNAESNPKNSGKKGVKNHNG